MLPNIFRTAKQASIHSDHPRFKLGAAVYKKNRSLGVGFNQITKKHPISANLNPDITIHAEMAALLACRHKHDLTGATIVVYRESTDGLPAMSRPCSICRAVLISFGIKEMIYTTKNGWAKEVLA